MSSDIKIELQSARVIADGKEFGNVGCYEYLTGWIHFEIEPNSPLPSKIVDLENASKNEHGNVEYSSQIHILRPVDPTKSNRRLFFDYGNRGNKRAIQYFNDAVASNEPVLSEECGNGFLFRRGYSIVWVAWQGDLLPGDGRLTMRLPKAIDKNGPITGKVRTEFIATKEGETTFPLSGWISTRSHPTISLDTKKAKLTRRQYPDEEREVIPPSKWSFARVDGGQGMDFQGKETAIVSSDIHIHLPTTFQTGWIYELIYTAKDPLVMGLGHLVVRDAVSFLRYNKTSQNPFLKYEIEKTFCFGRSQTGRCIRDFIYHGFNEDHLGRKVFDGALTHVAGAGKMWLNHRFANGVVPGGQQYEEHDNISDQFPFAYNESTDHNTGKVDAICKRPLSDPLIFHTQTSTEYWQRRGSLVHTDTKGNDLAPPDNVRIYHWASAQHVGNPLQERPTRGICQNPENVLQTSMIFRALLDALDNWVSRAITPPDNQIPTNSKGTLVDFKYWKSQFPKIPNLVTPKAPNKLFIYDYGPKADLGIFDTLPPRKIKNCNYVIKVPSVDDDGNEIAGIRVPMLGTPLATYTGWNIRSRYFGEGAMHEFSGSTLIFPETDAVRRMTNDPRKSIEERYKSKDNYLMKISAAATDLIKEGFMLEEDFNRVIDLAQDWCSKRHDIRL